MLSCDCCLIIILKTFLDKPDLVSMSFQEMSADVYSQLLKALVMPDKQDTSFYPVRVSASGAIATLIDVIF